MSSRIYIMSKKKMRPALVRWRDAHTVAENWGPIEDLDLDPFIVETVGWLLPEGTKDGHHVLVLSHGHGLVGDGISIPDGMVLKVEFLQVEPS